MIILGDRHQFSEMEMQYLQQKFSSINHISYKDTDSKPTIKKIENIVINCNKSIILLNTKAQIPNELLSYLVKLEIQGTKYLTTESFLEQWFHKCYIPEDQSNISFLEKIKPYATLQYIQKRFI
ncbi:MAG: sugar transferase, partial [Sulfurovum sp.]|nr:sugar transferase [Sulfurovum sp.]